MKKFQRFSLCALFALCSLCASAYDFSAKNDDGVTIYYNILSDEEASVTYGGNSYRSALYSGTVVIPETVTYGGTTYSVTSIDEYAFNQCTSLTSITIPESVTTIGNIAFASCSGLMSLDIPDDVTTIGYRAFYQCSGLTSVALGNSVTEIESQAFVNCSNLTYVNMNNCIAEIGSLIFLGCTNLEKFEVAESNQTYNTSDGVLFSKDMATLIIFPLASPLLPSYDIPNSVSKIENYAFYGCSGLTSIGIPNSVTTIGEGAFPGCTRLSEFKVSEDNQYFCEKDGVLFSKDMTMLVSFPLSSPLLPTYNIPNSVMEIGDYAFYTCTGLVSMDIPDSVASIGGSAFYECMGLTTLTLGNGVSKIGSSAFEGCKGLTSLDIPDSVTTIGDGAFQACTGLTLLSIGNSVATIGDATFFSCSKLESIYSLNREAPICDTDVFFNVPTTTCTLHVPIGSYSAYATAYQWKDFLNIVEMDMTGIENIEITTEEAEVTGYYTTDGKAVKTPQRGINILRYSDGTTKKVLVK